MTELLNTLRELGVSHIEIHPISQHPPLFLSPSQRQTRPFFYLYKDDCVLEGESLEQVLADPPTLLPAIKRLVDSFKDDRGLIPCAVAINTATGAISEYQWDVEEPRRSSMPLGAAFFITRLKEVGAQQLRLIFTASDDSGFFLKLEITGEHVSDSAQYDIKENAFSLFLYQLLCATHHGWKADDGSEGSVEFDVKQGIFSIDQYLQIESKKRRLSIECDAEHVCLRPLFDFAVPRLLGTGMLRAKGESWYGDGGDVVFYFDADLEAEVPELDETEHELLRSQLIAALNQVVPDWADSDDYSTYVRIYIDPTTGPRLCAESYDNKREVKNSHSQWRIWGGENQMPELAPNDN